MCKPIKICIIYLFINLSIYSFIILLLLFKYIDIGWSSNIATCNLNTSSHTYICIHQSLALKDIKLITRVYPSSHIIYIYIDQSLFLSSNNPL